MKSLFAMVILTCIASIFALNQLGNNASLPPLTTDLMQSLAPVVNNHVSAAPAIVSHNGLISPVFSPEVQRWAPNIVAWANDFNVDPNAVATIMQIESCGDPLAESWAGAQGLFQVMPFHFEAHEQMKDPDTNARRGVAYFALGMEMTNDNIGRSLAGYNGGHGTAKRDYNTWPHETQRYFYWGTGIYDDASRGLEISPRLDEWMAAGGASLCAQAASRNVSMHTQ